MGRVKLSFSPLFIGAMVATPGTSTGGRGYSLSVPFSSGQWLLPSCYLLESEAVKTFSPLFIGAMVATYHHYCSPRHTIPTFSPPFHRGNGCYCSDVIRT